MVNKSKKMEVNEMIKPNIINGLDFTFSSLLDLIFVEDKFLSFFLFIRFGKGLITIKIIFKLITYSFEQIFMVINNILTTYYRCKFHMNAEFGSPWGKMLKNLLIAMSLT